MDKRRSKENYYLDIADAAQERSTCLRRRYGAIIVRDDEIVATGYNGAPRGRQNCTDLGYCTRKTMNVPAGEYNPDTAPCAMCRRLIINAGIRQVVCRTGPEEYSVTDVSDWIEQDDSLQNGEEVNG